MPNSCAASPDWSGRIVVVGSINMDVICYAPTLPFPGETITGTRIAESPGGKGSDQAIAAARAGGIVAMIGALGSDPFADTLKTNLQSADVDTGVVRRVAGPTGLALITVSAAAENTIVVIPGANASVGPLSAVARAAIASASVVLAQLEVPLDVVLEVARAASAARVPFVLNPSPVRPLPEELVPLVTLLLVNEGEADAVGSAITARVPHVITTLGARGAQHRGPDSIVRRYAAPSVTPVDTTGAGDAFTGALVAAWASGLALDTAILGGCAAGSIATTAYGAAESAATAQALDEMLARCGIPASPQANSSRKS